MFFTFKLSHAIALTLCFAACMTVLLSPGDISEPVMYDVPGSPAVPAAETCLSGCSPVLIIDPGHGGEDGGAVSPDGMLESDLNLDISLRLRCLAGLFGIKTVMTRERADIDYPDSAGTTSARKVADQRARVQLINSVPDGTLISIHQNKFPDSRPSGTQVFYAVTDGSQTLAETAHNDLSRALCPENRRVAAPISKDIYLMKNVNCTAVLVECGFLSNPEESAKLATEEYRLKIASVLICSYMRYTQL